ncbi:MAG: hypothetical protein EXQ49_07620 [Acidobacteria bacterium]|jgi:hypothetical protein|nr:hypothetical protein [Acidobacteriota bacterium]
MRTITTSAGTPVDTDGDVLAVIETISRDLARRADLDYGFEEVEREFQHLINQLTPEELRVYLKESLFMSFNRFENERLMAVVRRASEATDGD